MPTTPSISTLRSILVDNQRWHLRDSLVNGKPAWCAPSSDGSGECNPDKPDSFPQTLRDSYGRVWTRVACNDDGVGCREGRPCYQSGDLRMSWHDDPGGTGSGWRIDDAEGNEVASRDDPSEDNCAPPPCPDGSWSDGAFTVHDSGNTCVYWTGVRWVIGIPDAYVTLANGPDTEDCPFGSYTKTYGDYGTIRVVCINTCPRPELPPFSAGPLGVTRCCLAEDHPGRGTPFKIKLGTWNAATDSWDYDTTEEDALDADPEYEWQTYGIDWFYAEGFSWPLAGATGNFEARPSDTYGTIWHVVGNMSCDADECGAAEV